jgi:predicted phosphoribosyltransferase/pimeloyl-ACP methyl ester carboxylesterase
MTERPTGHSTGATTSVERPRQTAGRGIVFRDRHDAGARLAALLQPLRDEHPVVFAIPRGGVPVGAEVARALGAPLDVVAVRKVGAPQNPEFAIGAVAEAGVHVLGKGAVRALGLPESVVAALVTRAEGELEDRMARDRALRPAISPVGRTAIVVDDGLATGRTALAAVRSLRRRGAARVILAVPVAAPDAAAALEREADAVLCVETPAEMWAVGYWYEHFAPTSEREVAALLDERAHDEDPPGAIAIELADGRVLGGDLDVPPDPAALVVFAHGSGSSRFSRRNRAVASRLADAGYATLLMDLLVRAEEGEAAKVFDIPLLASRLAAASRWARERRDTRALAQVYFGASTGAAAALTAAACEGAGIAAVISRGGRPDLARGLEHVRAPTLLIVGGEDRDVLVRNRLARRRLGGLSELAVIPGAGHLFEEPGALEQVATLAVGWLERYVRDAGDHPPG